MLVYLYRMKIVTLFFSFLITQFVSSIDIYEESQCRYVDFIEFPVDFKSSFPEVKIVGGNVAPHIYPYMASLQVFNGKKWNHFCGATLIKRNILLTAAHCVKYLPPNPSKNYRAVLGKYVLSSKTTKNVYIRPLLQTVIHPEYNSFTNDLAVVRIKDILNVPTINYTIPVPPENTMLTVIGWGYTQQGSGKTSNVLMQVNVPVVSLSICKKSYPSVTDKNVCAGYKEGGKDSCSGDSGGPLFINQTGNVQQIGIVSYGRGCAEPDYYGVYTNVYYYRNWINSHF